MFDFHMHTTISDGVLSPEEIIELSIKRGLKAIAITDHNRINPHTKDLAKKYEERIQIVEGCEFSCLYYTYEGKRIEVHVVGLGFEGEKLKNLAESNKTPESYHEALRRNFFKLGIEIPSLEKTIKTVGRNPDTPAGRSLVCDYMAVVGITKSREEGLNVYLGDRGEKRAYVNKMDYASFCPFGKCIKEIIKAGGVPVLAHPYKYGFKPQETQRMIRIFAKNAKEHPAAMEVFYRKYNEEMRKKLKRYADRRKLLYSSASDSHGGNEYILMNKEHLQGVNLRRHAASVLTDALGRPLIP